MNLEELSKSQIILLTVLVSFITAIATGIVTVSLLDETSGGISQTVHRVVERTVQRVSPEGQNNMAGAGASQKEKTVVVKEGNAFSTAISNSAPGLVNINKVIQKGTTANTEKELSTTTASSTKPTVETTFSSMGVIISSEGLIAAPSPASKKIKYIARLSNGSRVDLKSTGVSGNKLTLFKVISDGEKKKDMSSVELAKVGGVSLGEKVISINNYKQNSVAAGIVSSLPEKTVTISPASNESDSEKSNESDAGNEKEKQKTVEKIVSIKTDINSNMITVGSPLLDLSGRVIGIAVSSGLSGEYTDYIPAHKARELLKEYRNEQSEQNSKNNEESEDNKTAEE